LDAAAAAAASPAAAGAKSGNIEAPVANNPTVYGINTVVLALAASLAATNPQLVSSLRPQHQSHG
jgi:hypothetical protein